MNKVNNKIRFGLFSRIFRKQIKMDEYNIIEKINDILNKKIFIFNFNKRLFRGYILNKYDKKGKN